MLIPSEAFAYLRAARGLLLAVSGGPDSLALMALMAEWRDAGGKTPPLFVATVDHNLRPQSRAEATMVGELAARFGLPHAILEWRGAKPATGLPAAARAARYRLLATHAQWRGADHVVTAHHADDQAETVLMRLFSGSGPAGLAGMAKIAPLAEGEAPQIAIARPLLDAPKDELIAYCRARGLTYCEDPTNEDEAYRRPRIRAMRPPLEMEGLTRARLLRFAARCARQEEALRFYAQRALDALPADSSASAYRAPLDEIARLPEEILLRLLQREIARLAPQATRVLPSKLALLEEIAKAVSARRQGARTLCGVGVYVDGAHLTLKILPPRRAAALSAKG